MIRFQDIKEGDIIQTDFGGQRFEGVVTDLNLEDKQVCVHNGDEEAWFEPNDLYPIPVNDQQLHKLGFEKQENGDHSVKYSRGPFRILIPDLTNSMSWRSGTGKIAGTSTGQLGSMNCRISIIK